MKPPKPMPLQDSNDKLALLRAKEKRLVRGLRRVDGEQREAMEERLVDVRIAIRRWEAVE
jgi:hypothetical protein